MPCLRCGEPEPGFPPEERALILITTITRYLPNVRAALALLNTEDCTTNADKAQFDTALQRFLRDARDPGPGTKATLHPDRNLLSATITQKRCKEGVSPTKRDLPAYDPSKATA